MPNKKKADLHKVLETQCQHLTMTQRNELLKLLHKFEDFFDGKLGTWKTDPIDFKLKGDAKPICSRSYPVPKVHEEMFKKYFELLFLLGVLEIANDPEWGSPPFAKHKPKSNQVLLLRDFRNINKKLNQKPYPIPKINEMLLKSEGFQYDTSLGLNMGYDHI